MKSLIMMFYIEISTLMYKGPYTPTIIPVLKRQIGTHASLTC